jgi:hypothetical protein
MFLNDRTFLKFAFENYSGDQDFLLDVGRCRSIHKQLRRSALKHHEIINHLICLKNCFGTPASITMLRFRIREHVVILNTFLRFLSWEPDAEPHDQDLLELLRSKFEFAIRLVR